MSDIGERSPNTLEKGSFTTDDANRIDQLEPSLKSESVLPTQHPLRTWYKELSTYGVETRGIKPVPVEQRTESTCLRPFFIWVASGASVLTFSSGSLGPLVFGLNIRDSCLVIVFFTFLSGIPPAYIGTWGPKLGMRQMVQARYSFGYFGAIVPSVLTAFTLTGFAILAAILAGQTLASASSDGDLSQTVGICIVCLVSFLLGLCGYKFMSWFGRITSALMCIALVVALGIGGKDLELGDSLDVGEPATARAVLSFASTVIGFTLCLTLVTMDYQCFIRPDVSSRRLFLFNLVGITIPTISFLILGAVFAAASVSNPVWSEGYMTGNVGGLLAAVLRPAGAFGKILVVSLSLSLTINIAGSVYSVSLISQTFLPVLSRLPRFIFSIVFIALIVPLAIVASPKFQATLTNFLALIASWIAAFTSIILTEHLVLRRSFDAYDLSHWNVPRKLPSGISALVAGAVGMALAVPCIDQVWYVGPIAAHTGDIGSQVAFVASAVVYVPLRMIERRWFRERSGLQA